MEIKQQAGTAAMYKNLAVRLRNLFVAPFSEWQRIHREPVTFNDMLSTFALPLIAIVTMATFISHLINQQAFIFELALKKALLVFMALFAGLFIAWYLVFRLMKYFQMVPSRELAAKLTIFSSMPLYVASLVTALVPEFFFIQIVSLYGFYLAWAGTRNLPGPGQERKFIFSVFIAFSILVLPFLVRVLLLNLLTI
ncbi:MAG: Yip1 family protein [Bacteroidota bacterium]